MSTEQGVTFGVQAELSDATLHNNFLVLKGDNGSLCLWPEDPGRIRIGEQSLNRKHFQGTLFADVIEVKPDKVLVGVISRGLEHIIWVEKGSGKFIEEVETRIPKQLPKK